MATYAVITGNYVSNLIVADNKEEMESILGCLLVEYTEDNPTGIGWTYENGAFVPPPTPEIPEEPVIITE